MKSITINGLTFTDTPPTKEGCYSWVPSENRPQVYHASIVSMFGSDKLEVRLAGYEAHEPVEQFGGFWAEMVPRQTMAEEIKAAYMEGYRDAFHSPKSVSDEELEEAYADSRAILASEGKANP